MSAVTVDGPVKRRWGHPGGALLRIPRAAWACVLIASLNAACWSLITPPFQAPDEPSHFAYVQRLAETGRLPASNEYRFSQEEEVALSDLHQEEVRWHPEAHTISSPPAQERLQRDLALPLSRIGPGGAGTAAPEPPAYYALETLPYYLGSGGTLLERLELMRLLSALLAGLTALCAFLFVRESLPGAPWAWAVGGLGVALFPLLGASSGVVSPDAMLVAISSAIFYCLARAFRRGLTRKPAVAIGVLTATGSLAKLNFIGLAPGVLLGLVVLAFRGIGDPRAPGHRRAFDSMAIAIAIAMSPICGYLLDDLVEHNLALGLVSSAVHLTSGQRSFLGEVSYIWQLYLPRLPGMTNQFPGLSTLRQLWFDRAVGLYGWLDTGFPVWVYNFALIPAGVILALGIRTLVTCRGVLRARASELLVYAAISVGVLVLIGASSRLAQEFEGTSFAQPRYLLPMLPLLAAVLVIGARGAGRRWGPAVGVSIVTLFLAHDLFSQLQVIARYYG